MSPSHADELFSIGAPLAVRRRRRRRRLDSSILVAGWLLVGAVSIQGCGGGGSGDPASTLGEEGIEVSHDGVVRDANIKVSRVNTFWFDEGQRFSATALAGWTDGGHFGTITARVMIKGRKGEAVQPGTYRLIADAEDYKAEEMTATLVLEHGVAGLPFYQRSVSGTLELEAIEGDLRFRLDRLALTFEGLFQDGNAEDLEEENAISGSIRLSPEK